MSPLFCIYRSLTACSGPFLKSYLNKRLQKGKEHAERIAERFGEASLPRPAGKVMWVHGASLGELLSIMPLVKQLYTLRPDWTYLITTGTVSGAAAFEKQIPTFGDMKAIHQFMPVDHPAWVKKFIDHWKPDAALWLESELWPNVLHELKKQNVPLMLVNGRMRPKTIKKWRYMPCLAKKMLSSFKEILVQAREFLPVFTKLGAEKVTYMGNIKFSNPPPPVKPELLEPLQQMIGGRTTIGTLSTHPTDEALFGRTFKELKKDFPDLLGIAAPRHATRAQDIKDELEALGLKVAVRSRNEPITRDVDIYIADTMGEMGLWYTLCLFSVTGGSFFAFGGQNCFEGTHYGCFPVYGPHMFNFTEMVNVLDEGGVSVPVAKSEDLYPALLNLLKNPEIIKEKDAKGRALAVEFLNVMPLTAKHITEQVM